MLILLVGDRKKKKKKRKKFLPLVHNDIPVNERVSICCENTRYLKR